MIENKVFYEQARASLTWLESLGFAYQWQSDELSSTGVKLLYQGAHVAFEIGFDYRDQCIDDRVVQVDRGTVRRLVDGGYSNSVYSHLVDFEGYRGPVMGEVRREKDDTLVAAWFDGFRSLLETAGQKLLADDSDSLGDALNSTGETMF